jgi:hypothetical protein
MDYWGVLIYVSIMWLLTVNMLGKCTERIAMIIWGGENRSRETRFPIYQQQQSN